MRLSPKFTVIIRRTLLSLACLATVAALFVFVENWRGDRAWAAVERELLAKGERLDPAAFQPAPVADEQNFLKAPTLARLLYERPGDAAHRNFVTATRLMEFDALGSFRGELKDFSALRERLRRVRLLSTPFTSSPAADVLAALEPLKPLLDEVRDAARSRPQAALDPRATPLGPPLVNADVIYRLAQALAVRAAAEVELGRFDDAFADLQALQRLANALATPPANLLQILVATAMHGLAADAIADGCRRHGWTAPQLVQFEQHLQALRPLAHFGEALRGERVQFLYALDTRPEIALGSFSWPFWFVRGWAQQNKAAYCRRLDAEVFSAFSFRPDRIAPFSSPSSPRRAEKTSSLSSPYTFVADMALTNVREVLGGFGETIDRLELASTSWTLERHRLAHQRFPETLDELVPSLLPAIPRGIFDGQPFRYRRLPDGAHQLYSCGKNGRDDNATGDDIVLNTTDAS